MARTRFINVDFKPDLKVVRQDMARIAASFEHKQELMGLIVAEAKHDVGEMFENQEDAFGAKWRYWKRTPEGSRSYAYRAEKLPNIGILNRSDNPDGLKAKATAWEAFSIVGDKVTYGHNLPDWAGVHLHGGKKVQPDGYKIPRRSFYPFSKAAANRVGVLFAGWAEGNIAVIPRISSRGRVWTQVQTRVPTGRGRETRFGPSPL